MYIAANIMRKEWEYHANRMGISVDIKVSTVASGCDEKTLPICHGPWLVTDDLTYSKWGNFHVFFHFSRKFGEFEAVQKPQGFTKFTIPGEKTNRIYAGFDAAIMGI